MPTLEARVVDALRRARLTLACAESATAGLLGARLTRVVGAGDVFQGGLICYQDDVKARLLGVDRRVLEEKGAVSREVARQMAEGARRVVPADVAVSITGFAGPNVPPGGEVGHVFLGVAHARGTDVHDLHLPGDRDAVRETAVERALEEVLAVASRS